MSIHNLLQGHRYIVVGINMQPLKPGSCCEDFAAVVAQWIVASTISNATSNDNLGIITIIGFRWLWFACYSDLQIPLLTH